MVSFEYCQSNAGCAMRTSGTADPLAYLTKKGFETLTLCFTSALSRLKGVATKTSLPTQPTASWKLRWTGKCSLWCQLFFNLNFRLFWLFRVQYEVHGVQSFPCVVWYSKEAITEMDKHCIYLKHKTIKECTTAKAELFQSKLILHSYCLNFFSGSFICCYEYHTCTNLKENADGPCLCG